MHAYIHIPYRHTQPDKHTYLGAIYIRTDRNTCRFMYMYMNTHVLKIHTYRQTGIHTCNIGMHTYIEACTLLYINTYKHEHMR